MDHPRVINQSTVYNRFGKKFIIDTYQAEDGVQFDWAYLDSPNSSLVVSVTPDKMILLVRQYRFNLGIYTYENPAGGSSIGEDPLDAAKRELLEETGYETSEIISLGRFYNMPSEVNRWVNIYFAKDIVKKSEPPLDSDVEKYFDMSFEIVSIDEAESKMEGIEHLYALHLAKKYL
jgi:ADP-ribose pyrophosphatase